MKEQIKQKLMLRLKMAGFILSLVGWFMLLVVPLEFAGFNFAGLESFIETSDRNSDRNRDGSLLNGILVIFQHLN